MKPYRTPVVLILFLVFLLIWVWEVSAQIGDFSVKNYSLEDGLSQSTVYTIKQDSRGFIWLGTRDGLNRFDGYSFKTYWPKIPEENQYNNVSVRTILVSKEEPGLWLGTDGNGVYKYDTLREKFVHFSDLFTHKHNGSEVPQNFNVLSMVYDSDNNILVGTRSDGIWKLDLSEKRMFRVKPSFTKDVSIWALVEDTSNHLWAGTEDGLFIFDEDAGVKHYLEGKRVVSIKKGDNSVYWVGTYRNGLFQLNPDNGVVKSKLKRLEDYGSFKINTLFPRGDSRLWIGSADHGIISLNTLTNTYQVIEPDENRRESLSDRAIRSFFQDRSGVIWIGTNTGGVDNWSGFRNKFNSITAAGKNGDLNNRVVLSIHEINNGNLWVGTPTGLNIFSDDMRSVEYLTYDLNNPLSISDHPIITIEEDQSGTVWIGTDGGGLQRWRGNGNSFNQFLADEDNPETISNNSVLTLEANHSGMLWVGTFKGLNLFDPQEKKVISFTSEVEYPVLNEGRILSLLENLENKEFLWAGTYANGLYRIDLKRMKAVSIEKVLGTTEGVPQNRIQTLYLDNKNTLWIGCYSGLVRINLLDNKIKQYTKQHGLPNNVVYGILPDDNGHLWLSTNDGISRFNTKTQTFYNFGMDDGIPGREFNGGAYHKNREGLLFFGGVKGLTYFHPEKIQINNTSPPIVITDFRLAGIEQPAELWNTKERVDLTYNENFFSFSFSALDFVAPQMHQYQYKLEGLDSDWIDAGNKRDAFYTSIPPGEYTFRVRGSNADGVWSENSAAIKLSIAPPFWQTWWFQLIGLVTIIGLVYTVYRYRIESIFEILRTRERIAGDLHDDLGATLSSISLFSQAAEKKLKRGETDLKYLHLITESADKAKENLTDIIWSIDPEKDDWELYAAKCRRYAADVLESNDIDYNLSITPDINLPNDINLRKNLWLIFKELVINAAKHSNAGLVDITCHQHSKALVLVVEDDGEGIRPEDHDKGNGLKNIRRRAEDIGAQLELDSEPGKGTRWQLKIYR